MIEKYRILMVCTANYCRSPSAQGLVQHLVDEADLTKHVELDSAGTHDFRVGQAPDPSAIKAASDRAIDISHLRARLIEEEDFHTFDLILGMDLHNFATLSEICPRDRQHKVRMFMDFAAHHGMREVPDPFRQSYDRFETMFELLEDASRGLIGELKQRFGKE